MGTRSGAERPRSRRCLLISPYISSHLPNLPPQVACRATSIKPHIDALSVLVLRWRKMELHAWPALLATGARRHHEAALVRVLTLTLTLTLSLTLPVVHPNPSPTLALP